MICFVVPYSPMYQIPHTSLQTDKIRAIPQSVVFLNQ